MRSGSTTSWKRPRTGITAPSGPFMSIRMAPPGRASASQTGLVNPCGPHHRASRSGSVHALKTSARGASKVRVRTTSRLAVSSFA